MNSSDEVFFKMKTKDEKYLILVTRIRILYSENS